MQAIAAGRCQPEATLRRLTTLAGQLETGGRIAPLPAPRIRPGSRLIREGSGRTHAVNINDDGFEFQGVSFVSVTPACNTTSSRGRLTLNVSLSFARFGREVAGERIRDKIAASKRKDMRMGGQPPLGYDVKERKLVVNAPEAATVREIYRCCLEPGADPSRQENRQARVRAGLSKAGGHSDRGGNGFLLSDPPRATDVPRPRHRRRDPGGEAAGLTANKPMANTRLPLD